MKYKVIRWKNNKNFIGSGNRVFMFLQRYNVLSIKRAEDYEEKSTIKTV